MKVVDLFSGAGGFTEGAEQAGLEVIFGANHWPLAVEIHAANHPKTQHACQDLQQIDWRTVPAHDLLIASPSCVGHSLARGKDMPHHNALRSTAWAVVSCVEVHRPKAFVVENVPLFEKWELYEVWREAMIRMGYRLKAQVFNAQDFGVPQNRKRLFIVGSRVADLDVKAPGIRAVPMRNLIDWDEGNWRPVSACKSRLFWNQYENGRAIHGDRFLIGYHSDKRKGVSLDGPIGTLTTKAQWVVVDGDRYRFLTIKEIAKAMGFPESYKLPKSPKDALTMLGNAVPPPMSRSITAQVASQLQNQRYLSAAA